jgi:hypothetical protein
MYATKNIGSRHCFRCSLPLTDAASLNEGIGPICRKLDNSILARLIPSDMAKVLAAYRTVDVLSLTPETLDTFMALEAAFRADDAPTREDWRKEVKRIEWILSHHQTYLNIEALKAVVLGLGYVGIVSLWSGEAATGLASVFAIDGRLFFQGPQNKAGRIAFKKIYGFKFHPASSDFPKACWSFPADKFREVRLAVITHYPNFSGLLEAVEVAQALVEEQKALEAAKLAALPPVVVAAPVTPPAPANIISLVEVGDTLKVKTPFRTSYIAELRSTPKDALPRKWNADEKVWEFPVSHKAKVEALVQKHYGWH